MSYQDVITLLLSILGGVALFMVGMGIMTDGLRQAAGEHLRVILSRATDNRYAGVGFGTVLGFLVHSGPATVMMVGFVNAGLMTLVNAIPLLMGASIGTTLAMQLVSLRLVEYAFLAIGLGFLAQMVFPHPVVKQIGRAVVGFGLLFLGMDYLGNVVSPYSEELSAWLSRIDGTTWLGMLTGIAVATVFTVLVQSSGATIGMVFAMAGAGVFTTIEQVYPIVLGSHIGTASTALVISMSANLEARRAALANLFYQVFNVALAVAAAPFFIWLVEASADDLVRQTANLHTAVMVAAVAVLAPATGLFARGLYALTPSRSPVWEKSFLEREYLHRPEKALTAAVLELGRSLEVCRENFKLTRQYIASPTRSLGQRIGMNEKIINEIKPAVKSYLANLTRGYLSRRQALMIQYLNHCMADIERIGDHIESMRDVRSRQAREEAFAFDEETVRALWTLCDAAAEVLDATCEAFSRDREEFAASGQTVLDDRDRFDNLSAKAKAKTNERIAAHELHPIIGLFFSDYASALDRIVKHAKMIGRELQQPFFRLKQEKMAREVEWQEVLPKGEQKIPEPLPKPRQDEQK